VQLAHNIYFSLPLLDPLVVILESITMDEDTEMPITTSQLVCLSSAKMNLLILHLQWQIF
jgi:hypothetical protein